jgi:hypothetical protein
MFPGSVIRKLARSEEMFAQSQTYFGATAVLTGEVDVDAMSAAFDALLQAHPVLAGHLESGPDGLHQIVADDFLHPGLWVTGGEGRPAAPTARMRLNQTVSLVNLRLHFADGHAELTLYSHHCMVDGQHQFGLLSELFSWYTDLVLTGRIDPVVTQPAPRPLEVLLEERGIRKQSRSGIERFLPAMFAYELPPSTRNSAGGDPALPEQVPTARCRLTESETANVVTFCRTSKLSLNAVIGAAVLMAEWQIRKTPNIPIPYLYPVDLRLLLTPPVEATESTNPLGIASYLATIKPDTQIADLAADIIETFRDDLSEGVILQSLLHFNLQYGGTPPGMPDVVMVTEGGVVPDIRTPAGLTIHELRTEFHTASAAGVDLYTTSIFAGRLQVEHLSHSPDPERPLEAIHSLLCSVTSDDDDNWMAE